MRYKIKTITKFGEANKIEGLPRFAVLTTLSESEFEQPVFMFKHLDGKITSVIGTNMERTLLNSDFCLLLEEISQKEWEDLSEGDILDFPY